MRRPIATSTSSDFKLTHYPLTTYGVFWLLFGIHSSSAMVGFSVGYVAYAALHTWFHYGAGMAFGRLRWRHVLHHRRNVVNYGVTTSLWDRVFGTEAH